MKLKNHYAWLCPFWIISTICDSLACVVNFVEGNLAVGLIFLVLAVAFAFVGGILLDNALTIRKHNKTCDWLDSIAEDLRDEYMKKIEQ